MRSNHYLVFLSWTREMVDYKSINKCARELSSIVYCNVCLKLYFSITIITVAVFGVVDESPSSSSTESTADPRSNLLLLHLNIFDNVKFILILWGFFYFAALQVLNIFVVTLSGFGLVSTCLLIYGLIKVSFKTVNIRTI
jgi:hypothetical protein